MLKRFEIEKLFLKIKLYYTDKVLPIIIEVELTRHDKND